MAQEVKAELRRRIVADALDSDRAVWEAHPCKVFVANVALDRIYQLWVLRQVSRLTKHVAVSLNQELVAVVSAIDYVNLVSFLPLRATFLCLWLINMRLDIVCVERIEFKR